MRITHKHLLLGLGLLAGTSLIGQEYRKMMADPNVPMTEIKKAAEEYWKDKYKGKGSGFKQYKRWEHEQLVRFGKSGSRFNASAQALQEFSQFKKQFPTKRNVGTWIELGPRTSHNVTGHWAPGIGRIDIIDVNPNNPDEIYCGTPSGGLWHTTNSGKTWRSLADDVYVPGIAEIAIDWNNPSVIYIATGDHAPTNKMASIGVLKSTDSGQSWSQTGLTFNYSSRSQIRTLDIHPSNPNVLFCGTNSGLYMTSNAGSSWSVVKSVAQNEVIDDFEFKPGDPSTMYCTTYNQWGNSGFYKSSNGGSSWSAKGTFQAPDTRLKIAVSADSPNTVYALNGKYNYDSQAKEGGLHVSTNSGESFTFKGENPGWMTVADFSFDFCANPDDADILICGDLDTFRSLDGGNTWEKITEWNIDVAKSAGYAYNHADVHFLRYYGGVLYTGTDGLITRSYDDGKTMEDLTEGIGCRQFNNFGSSEDSPYKFVLGSQDNGTSVYTNGEWHEWLGADGGDGWVNPDDDKNIYGVTQQGVFYYSTDGGYTVNWVEDDQNWQNATLYGKTAFVPPISGGSGEVFVGGLEVYRVTDGMVNGVSTFEKISNFGWTTNGYDRVGSLVAAPSNTSYLYVASPYSGFVKYTSNKGTSWGESSVTGSGNVTSIAVHPTTPTTVAATISSWTQGNQVYYSTNGGASWTNITGNLPAIPAYSVAFEGNGDGIYVGTEIGIYYRGTATGNQWDSYMNGLPNVRIGELNVNRSMKRVRAATHGRGLWEAPLYGEKVNTDASLTHLYNMLGNRCGTDQFKPQVILQNNGDNALTSATITIKLIDDLTKEETEESYNWTGNLSVGEYEFVDLATMVPAAANGYSMAEATVTVNGDENDKNNRIENWVFIGQGKVNYLYECETQGNSQADGMWITPGFYFWSNVPDQARKLNKTKGGNAFITNYNADGYWHNTNYVAETSCFDLTDVTNPELSFWMAYDLEPGYDIFTCFYSTDGGESWKVLGEKGANWFNNDEVGDPTDNYLLIGGQWTGTDAELKEYKYSLSNFTNESSIKFKFVMMTDANNTDEAVFEGVVFDDFTISGTTNGTATVLNPSDIQIVPNPATANFDLMIEGLDELDLNVKVISADGKLVLERQGRAQQMRGFDISDLKAGIYMLKIASGDQLFTQRLVVE